MPNVRLRELDFGGVRLKLHPSRMGWVRQNMSFGYF